MQIDTTRFATIAIEPDDIITFPAGLSGLDDCRHWVLLADARNEALGWLQSISRPEVALAVVSPRRFVPDYQLRVARADLQPLALASPEEAQVLAIVAKNDRAITLNLKAPLVINLRRRLGHQVVHTGDQPLQYEVEALRPALKLTA